MGKVFAPRKSYIISEQNKFVPGERLPLTNELLDGSIIDLGGCLLLFKSSVNESVSIENGTSEELNMVKTMNAHRPHCPVLFQPLQFSTISLQEKQHRMWNYVKSAHHLPNFSRNSTAPEFFLDDLNPQHSTPYVFSSCGHVYGYSKQLEGRFEILLVHNEMM